jgi:lysophospholipase L1-like esterase/pimeloyl-ACP methyl ester carboxylesterase
MQRIIMMKCLVGFLSATLCGICTVNAEAEASRESDFPGTITEWNGYERYDFQIDGRDCIVVVPQTVARGKPWIWRARFFGHEPQTDLALLAKGFHLVYMDVADLFGSPKAVAHWNAFYQYLTTEHAFAKKAALEGMSRCGLIIYNWAAANPGKVACIYADAPVCDFKSWPGGKGRSKGDPPSWQKCLAAYELTEEQALAYARNPIDNLEPPAQEVIPLLHVCGDADEVVPVEENTLIVEERYRKLGGKINVLMKKGVGHHPHSLQDPTPIVDFIMTYAMSPCVSRFQQRGGLANARIRFEKEKAGRVAFLGGSITENPGWRTMVCDMLQDRFPQTQFDFINAGIASTDTALAPFRLQSDVFSRGRVDLLFVEFAVNDRGNGRSKTEMIRGMEGVIRQARTTNPEINIVMLHFADEGKTEQYNQGKVPLEIACHEKVAEQYAIPSVNLAREVAERMNAREFDWENDFKNLHPSPFGGRIYARSINRLFDACWENPVLDSPECAAYPLPDESIDEKNYSRGRFVELNEAVLEKDWKYIPAWDSQNGHNRQRFKQIPILEALEPGATLRLPFSGTAVGIYTLAGPDVGMLEYRIDNQEFKPLDQYTQWSGQLHIPWAYMLDADLEMGAHTLILKTSTIKNEKSDGYASRIVKFLVN